MDGHTRTYIILYTHTDTCTFPPHAHKFTCTQKNMLVQACVCACTDTHTHTHMEGVRGICGSSHASPMKRYLLAVGVIIGHGGLFLHQRRPCQEMTDNRAQQWLARSAAAHVDPAGKKEWWEYVHIHQTAQHKPSPAFSLFANNMSIYIPLAKKQDWGSSSLRGETTFSDLIFEMLFVAMSSCKMKMLISMQGNWWFVWSLERDS